MRSVLTIALFLGTSVIASAQGTDLLPPLPTPSPPPPAPLPVEYGWDVLDQTSERTLSLDPQSVVVDPSAEGQTVSAFVSWHYPDLRRHEVFSASEVEYNRLVKKVAVRCPSGPLSVQVVGLFLDYKPVSMSQIMWEWGPAETLPDGEAVVAAVCAAGISE